MEFAGVATQELTVSTGSAFDDKERIRQAVDIVDLVGSHLQLRRQGRNYVALCPWHDDSRPSLQVNPERQSFKCWVCDIGGDIFSFVMQMEGVEFREAMQMLADRAGITLGQGPGHGRASSQNVPGQGGMPAPVGGERKRTLYKAMAWAEQLYHRCLLESPDAQPARDYLQQRGITAESIEQFNLGFAPNHRDWLIGQIKGSAERMKILETIGLIARSQDGGQFYERFRGRVLFSIRDTQNRAVGVGGRVLPESGATSPAKYINSPETPLFSKSNLLHGHDIARHAMRKTKTALVMEGYTDCIVAHQYGFTDAVAVLGTALNAHAGRPGRHYAENHIKILKRFVDRIVLVLDGDEAGQRRANEVLELFVAAQVDLRILTLPEGTDPCDFLQQNGAEAFRKLLDEQAVDALDHAFRSVTRGIDLQRDVHGASQALDRLVSIVAKAPR
ncbi:MAG TPA: DNA primase, partial [Thermoguttaceae bacterium]|nr:DNA primase [Thermoguttaceae bacterium]